MAGARADTLAASKIPFGYSVRYNGTSLSAFAGASFAFEAVSLKTEVTGEFNWTEPLGPSPYGQYAHTGTVGRFSLRGIVGYPIGRLEPYLAAGPAIVLQRHQPELLPASIAAHLGAQIAAGAAISIDSTTFFRLEANATFTQPATYDVGLGKFTANTRDLVSVSAQIGRNF